VCAAPGNGCHVELESTNRIEALLKRIAYLENRVEIARLEARVRKLENELAELESTAPRFTFGVDTGFLKVIPGWATDTGSKQP
jgi:hypothetical protein